MRSYNEWRARLGLFALAVMAIVVAVTEVWTWLT